MSKSSDDRSSWSHMALSAIAPAWLKVAAPESDVVLSTRCRIMRNLAGCRFPHSASPEELEQVRTKVLSAAKGGARSKLLPVEAISEAEREYLVGCRLISPDFAIRAPGRALLLDRQRATSVMVNEEDHLRVQGMAPGWNPEESKRHVESAFNEFEGKLEFAYSPRFGYLAASPYNCGQGRRMSAMLHLIALAQTKRLVGVLRALTARHLTARGLFGESSRPVGAFMQISMTDGSYSDFVGAFEYLVAEERAARKAITPEGAKERYDQSMVYLAESRTLGLADALRILAWARLAATSGVAGLEFGYRDIDLWLANLHLDDRNEDSAVLRARFLSKRFGL